MGNLYTFGCSYTENKYPTYGDYLAPYFDKHINYGISGAGNRSIFNNASFIVHDNILKEDDTVIIQWSSIPREDRMYGDRWQAHGVITHSFYDKEWIEKYFDYRQQTMELISYITTLMPLIKSVTPNLKWFFMLEPWFGETLGEPGFDGYDLPKKYRDFKESNLMDRLKTACIHDDFMKSIENFIIYDDRVEHGKNGYYYDENSKELYLDDHPTQDVHQMFSNLILKELGIDNIHEEELRKNALEWKEYTRDTKRLVKCEDEAKLKRIPCILYDKNNVDGAPRWPSNNSKKELIYVY